MPFQSILVKVGVLWKLLVPQIVVWHRLLPHTGERRARAGSGKYICFQLYFLLLLFILIFVFVQARIEAPSAASSVDSSVDTTASVDEGISDLSTHETIINPSTGNEKLVFDTLFMDATSLKH